MSKKDEKVTKKEVKPKKTKPKKAKNNDKKMIIISILVSFIIVLIFFGLVLLYNKKLLFEKPVTEDKKTILNQEISDGVDKIYNSVVTVENYIAGDIYSTGTGFVYKKDLEKIYIITNYHVIDSANEVYISFPNKEKYKTKIMGYDEHQDIAVLSMELKEGIKEVEIGDSKLLKIGDTTFTIGTPINQDAYAFTVTKGILSGKDRLVEYTLNSDYKDNKTSFIKVLQTDAAINSGNSGGPLCDINGRVVGVINLKISSNNVEGIGFAIPIEDVVIVADRIIEGKPIIRPTLPFSFEDIEEDKIYVSIKTMNEKDKHDLKEGDIILKVDDEIVKNSAYLKYIINNHIVGDIVNVTYQRIEKDEENNDIKKEYNIKLVLN